MRNPQHPLVQGRRQRRLRIRSIERFQALLAEEQRRSDRVGGTFAVLSITLERGDRRELRRVASLVTRRIRGPKAIGWLGPKRLGILINGTPDDGQPSDRKMGGEATGELRLECPAASDAASLLPEAQVAELGNGCKGNIPVRPLPIWKRTMDLIGATLLLGLSAPIFVVVALAIKLTSRGPVFFSQERAGLGGKPFRILKFRTMCVDAEARQTELREKNEQDGPAFKMKNDPRTTPLGRLLRLTSIDELPQLLNVLRGEMSLVGPRPLPCEESDACDSWHRRRLEVTPGLTCIWQVEGRNSVPFDEWMRMDIRYVESRSFWTDLKLLFRTVPAVLTGRGAS